MMGRAACCDKANVKKGPWSPEEDAKLISHIEIHGTGGNWISLPNKIGLKRCGKSCRLRWLNYLRPNLKHGAFTQDEDNLICNLYVTIGSREYMARWSIIAAQLPGRTDNDIKNYWNTRLKKKLFGKRRHGCVTPPPPPPPLPPPPTLADHALNMPPMDASFCYCNNLGGNLQRVSCSHDQVWDINAALMIDCESAAVNCSSSIENVGWEEEDMNKLLQFPHTNYQPSASFDEPRLLGFSQ